MSEEAKQAWGQEMQQTGAMAAWREQAMQEKVAFKRADLQIPEDGGFRVAGLPPGLYTVHIRGFEPDPAKPQELGEEVAEARVDFVLRETDAAEPLDLGVLELTTLDAVRVGEPAPDLEAPALAGEAFRLSDLRGRYVLLDFWATWCGPCIAMLPDIVDVHERYKDDPRLVVVGLSLDHDREALEHFVQERGLGWTQVYLGPWNETDVPDRFGVRGIPSTWLIGPDGAVLAKEMSGQGLRQAIERELGSPSPE